MVWRVEGSAGRVTDSRRKRVKAKRFEEGEEKKSARQKSPLIGQQGSKRWKMGSRKRNKR
jgi:hypothetical protein